MIVQGDGAQPEEQRTENVALDQTQKLELLLQVCTHSVVYQRYPSARKFSQDLSDAVEKVAALKSQMGGPASTKNPPPPEARPSYAELSALKEQLQRRD